METPGPRPPAPGPSALSTTYLFMMCLPTSVDPVNPIFRTSGWSDSLWPTSEPVRGRRGVGQGSHGAGPPVSSHPGPDTPVLPRCSEPPLGGLPASQIQRI